jgi:type II secretory ATPase GspE/PulE/Tfp pilus assembly ATPase PilB-like protein/nucleotide-binding universal stress UspA family protein
MTNKPPCFANVLFAADPGRSVQFALRRAVALAEQLNAELHVLRVLAGHRAAEPSAEAETALRAAKEELTAILPAEDVLKLSVHWEARMGEAAEEIVEYAKRSSIDLIILGSRRRRGLSRFFFGSVADDVHQRAPCPVLMIPLEEHNQNGDFLRKGAQVLQSEFGQSFGTDDSTRQRLIDTLAAELDLDGQEANVLLDRLETAKAVVWSDKPTAEGTSAGPTCRIVVADSELAGEASESYDWDPATLAGGGPAAPAYDLLQRAISLRATDVHIDPAGRDELTVRFRIDGRLERYCTLDGDIGEHLIKRFKTLADLDIADPFEPQEGYLRLPDGTESVQIRVTTAPVEGGETVCLRIHEEERMFRSLDALGLSTHAAEAMKEMLHRREGLVVVAGPTGSGKTTTIYSMLQELRSEENHLLIASIEDPVELNVPFLRQMSVNEARGMTLSRGLRTILRLDPDVLFVGEIRDGETTETTMRAASSGRYVFTTLHTREVAATITAFDDLNAHRRSLSANLKGIISQRLIRRLCTRCRRRRPIRDEERRIFERHEREAPEQLWEPQGCDDCRSTGYRGRAGVFEAVIVEDTIRDAIERGASESELRETIRTAGAPSLTSDALDKVDNGISSLDEVFQMRSV